MDAGVLEVMLYRLDHSVFDVHFTYLSMAFGSLVEKVAQQCDTNTMNDETKIYNLKHCFISMCQYLLREYKIKESSIEAKIDQIRASNASTLQSLLASTIKALTSLNYTDRVRDMLLDQAFHIFAFHPLTDDLYASMITYLVSDIAYSTSTLESLYYELANIQVNRECHIQWRNKCADIVNWINARKNSQI